MNISKNNTTPKRLFLLITTFFGATILFTPMHAYAIFALILLAAGGAFGAFVVGLIIDVIILCALGIICGSGGSAPPAIGVDATCDSVIIENNYIAEYTQPATAWGDSLLIEGDEVNIVGPADEIRLSWQSDADTCVTQFNSDEPESAETSGEYTFLPGEEYGVGGGAIFYVICQDTESTCIHSEAYGFETPEPNFDEVGMFTIAPPIVRQGGQANLSWNINVDGRDPYSMDCAIYGAIPDTNETAGITPVVDDAPFSFDAAEVPSWEVRTIPLMNKFVNTLICIEPVSGYGASASNEVEVIPAAQER